jgi:hypothetical protein
LPCQAQLRKWRDGDDPDDGADNDPDDLALPLPVDFGDLRNLRAEPEPAASAQPPAPEDEFEDTLDFDPDEMARIEGEAVKMSTQPNKQRANMADVDDMDDLILQAEREAAAAWDEEDIYE